jgi:hypothetical protein
VGEASYWFRPFIVAEEARFASGGRTTTAPVRFHPTFD